ncbi:MAG: terminase gpA endonuclease subunit [Luteolibacter sp.]
MNSIRKFLVGALKRAWRLIEKKPLEEWAEENIWIDSKESIDNPGPYKREVAVYAPRLLDIFMDDPQWRTLIVMKSSQSGLTFHVLIQICRRVSEIATSIMYVIDSLPKARDLSETRLQPLLRKCKALKIELGEGVQDSKLKTLSYNLRNSILRLAGSGSAGQVASVPADFVVGDELDKWLKAAKEAHKWLLLIQRIKKSEHGKALGFSTPTDEGGITNVGFQSGSQHRYFVPCPHCSHEQLMNQEHSVFSHCKEADGKTYNLNRVLHETFMKCEKCEGSIEEDHKIEMFLKGSWRPTNFKEIEVDGIKQLVPGWVPGEMSAHISDFYSTHPRSSWGVLAFEFIQAQGSSELLHNWTNGRAGLPVKKTVADVQMLHILRLRGNYKRGTLPIMPCIATLQVDNQGDHQKWLWMGFLPNGTRFVIDYGITIDRREIKDIMLRPIRVIDPETKTEKEIFVQAGIMDEGGKDGTSYEVRKFCKPMYPFMVPCKGRGKIQAKNTIHWSDSKLDKGGNETIGVCHFDDDAFKRELYIDLIRKHDPKRIEEFDLPRLWFPSNIDETFIREMCGEELVKELDAAGIEQLVWKSKPPNDYGDCVKMGGVLWNTIAHRFSNSPL